MKQNSVCEILPKVLSARDPGENLHGPSSRIMVNMERRENTDTTQSSEDGAICALYEGGDDSCFGCSACRKSFHPGDTKVTKIPNSKVKILCSECKDSRREVNSWMTRVEEVMEVQTQQLDTIEEILSTFANKLDNYLSPLKTESRDESFSREPDNTRDLPEPAKNTEKTQNTENQPRRPLRLRTEQKNTSEESKIETPDSENEEVDRGSDKITDTQGTTSIKEPQLFDRTQRPARGSLWQREDSPETQPKMENMSEKLKRWPKVDWSRPNETNTCVIGPEKIRSHRVARKCDGRGKRGRDLQHTTTFSSEVNHKVELRKLLTDLEKPSQRLQSSMPGKLTSKPKRPEEHPKISKIIGVGKKCPKLSAKSSKNSEVSERTDWKSGATTQHVNAQDNQTGKTDNNQKHLRNQSQASENAESEPHCQLCEKKVGHREDKCKNSLEISPQEQRKIVRRRELGLRCSRRRHTHDKCWKNTGKKCPVQRKTKYHKISRLKRLKNKNLSS